MSKIYKIKRDSDPNKILDSIIDIFVFVILGLIVSLIMFN